MNHNLKKKINDLVKIDFNESFNTISIIYCLFITFLCARNHYAIDEIILLNSLFNNDTLFFIDTATGKSVVQYIGLLLFKIGFTPFYLSLFLLLSTNLIFWFSCSNIIKKIITKNWLLIFIFTWILTQLNLFSYLNPSYEYPITYNPHLSTFSSALVIGSISLIISKKFQKSIFISLVNITIHPILGFFSFILGISFLFFTKKEVTFTLKKIKLKYIYIILFFIIFFGTSLFFTQNYIEISKNINFSNNFDTLNIAKLIYKKWDISHRNEFYALEFYIAIILFCSYSFFYFKRENCQIFNYELFILLITFTIPILIALTSQILLANDILLIEKYIPGRFLVFSSFVIKIFFLKLIVIFIHQKKWHVLLFMILFFTLPIIDIFQLDSNNFISLIPVSKLNVISFVLLITLLFFKNIFRDGNNFQKLIFIFLFFLVLFNFSEKKLAKISYFSNEKFGVNTLLVKQDLCPKIKKGSGVLVSNFYQYNYLLRSCEIVPFIMPHIHDGIFYDENRIREFINIFKIVYNVDLLNAERYGYDKEKIKFNENLFRVYWEKSSQDNFVKKLKKLKINYIVTPREWNVNLIKIFSFKKNSIYELF